MLHLQSRNNSHLLLNQTVHCTPLGLVSLYSLNIQHQMEVMHMVGLSLSMMEILYFIKMFKMSHTPRGEQKFIFNILVSRRVKNVCEFSIFCISLKLYNSLLRNFVNYKCHLQNSKANWINISHLYLTYWEQLKSPYQIDDNNIVKNFSCRLPSHITTNSLM